MNIVLIYNGLRVQHIETVVIGQGVLWQMVAINNFWEMIVQKQTFPVTPHRLQKIVKTRF